MDATLAPARAQAQALLRQARNEAIEHAALLLETRGARDHAIAVRQLRS